MRGRRPWKKEEMEEIMRFFSSDIKRGIIPSKEKATQCLEKAKAGSLSGRSWRDVKFCVYNKIKKKENFILIAVVKKIYSWQ